MGRIGNVYGDKPLACGCLPMEAYSDAADQLTCSRFSWTQRLLSN